MNNLIDKLRPLQIIEGIKQILEQNHLLGIKHFIEPISNYLDTFDTIPIEVTNYLKSVVQTEALQAWKNNKCIGLIAMATGTGKSKIVIDFLKENHKNHKGIYTTNLLVVPTEVLRDNNWKEEFDKWNGTEVFMNNVAPTCYASLNKPHILNYGYIICDEAHNLTENNSTFFTGNYYKGILALSATPPKDPIKKKILADLGIKVVYELPLDMAVKLRLVSPYEIVIVETTLDNKEKIIKGGTKKVPKLLTEKEQYFALDKKINYWTFIHKPSNQKMIDIAIITKMRFVYNLPSKLKAAKFIKSLLSIEERNLIFCGSIEQSKKLSQYQYNSKTTDVDLNRFINGEIDELSCVNALNEGINIGLVNNALIVQLNSNERTLIQRLGRTVRYTEGHSAKIIIICCTDSKDLTWVNKAIVNLDTNKIRRIKIEDLIEGKEKL